MKQAENEIKVFLASSEELNLERVYVGDLFNDINSNLINAEVRLRLFKWEFFDPGYRGERKQSEYDEKVKRSDVFIVLFRSKAGKFTLEEVETAVSAYNENKKPNELYCFFQDYQEKREFDIDDLKKKLGDGFTFDSFSDVKDLKFKLIKIIEPYLINQGVNITETEKFVKIDSENILRKAG